MPHSTIMTSPNDAGFGRLVTFSHVSGKEVSYHISKRNHVIRWNSRTSSQPDLRLSTCKLSATPSSTTVSSPSVTIRCTDGLIFLKNTSTEEEEVVLQRGNKKATVPLGACVQLRALDLIHIDDKLTMRWEPSAAVVKASPRGKKERKQQPLVLPSNEKEEEEVATR